MGRKKEFTGIWIPRDVWEDERLSVYDKVVLSVIASLARGESGCYATNKYLAEFCQFSERQVCKSIGLLTKFGYLRAENAGTVARQLFVCLSTSAANQRTTCVQSTHDMRSTNAQDASINAHGAVDEGTSCSQPAHNVQSGNGFLPSLSIDNNNYNNIYNTAREETDTKPTKKEIEDWCRERGSSVNPGRFFEYYEAVHWQDRDGTPVNWRQRILSWEAQEERRAQETGQADKAVPAESSFDTDSFFTAALARSEVPADDEIPPWMKGE